MRADPLTRIVKGLDLTGAVFVEGEMRGRWAFLSQLTEEDCLPYMPAPRQLVAYHVITEGEAIVTMDGYLDCVVRAGDVIFLPRNARIVMASDLSVPPLDSEALLSPSGPDGLVRLCTGGEGALTRMFCGFLASDAGPSPLLNTLPQRLVISIESLATQTWIEASIAMAARELAAGRLGSGALIAQLTELLLVEALRIHLDKGADSTGWLAGMSDPRIARALARIHASLDCPPAVTQLAETAGMSRSAFVDRFTELMGSGPRAYVLEHRMEAARLLLRDTHLSLAEVSQRVGYDAPEAFSRAFKREIGCAPAAWRNGQALAHCA
ncbi:MAG: AraC family transcriptional regulator [Pseudomonadota bacterium]